MATWSSVSNTALASEFPAFELCASFSVFNLNPNAQDKNFDDKWRTLALEKLANAFGQNPTDVNHHVVDIFPVAHHIFRNEGVPNTDAWTLAVKRP